MRRLTTSILALLLPPCAALWAQDVTIGFDLSQQGKRYQPTWGLDQAWISEQNLRKGINHMGKENIGIGRTCFRTTKALTNDSVLAADQTNYLRRRASVFNAVSATLPLVFTADQEAGSDSYFVVNNSCNVGHWAACINSHVHWMQLNTRHPIVGVSPFNEPDYWTAEEGATVAKQVQVAKLLREQHPRMDTIAIVGGNTLNDDKALTWYTSGKQYYDWGNTHQLAGSFDNFANFFQQLQKDGKVGYADEMHNVGEAMVGLEYGMTVGIWWGFDSRARGEFCDISRHGERLAYGEHRNNWTAASVYRHDDGRVKAFIGSSERQALTTAYQFVSLDRDVYFDGQGPQRQFTIEIPGGTGYQKGQTNAERVVDIAWRDGDVPPCHIADGDYRLFNKATGNAAAVSGTNVVMQKPSTAKAQQWHLALSSPRIGGDYSFYDITSVQNAKTRMNLQDFSTADGANIMAYSQNATPTSNEQWYLQYAGDGYYYIRCRESALYLAAASSQTTNGVNIVQKTMQATDAARNRLLWRLLPPDVDYETQAPAAPQGLSALAQSASVKLSWQAGDDDDLDGYFILRAEQGTDDWHTIARHAAPPYVDHSCLPGHTYLYKVRAIDRAQNIGSASDAVAVATNSDPALVARWTMDNTLDDLTENQRHAAPAVADALFDKQRQQGTAALHLKSGQYLTLPSTVVQGDELTVTLWAYPETLRTWQRLFDFGYDTNHYLFLTSSNGSRMRLGIKNGGAEQTLDAPRLSVLKWKHVALTMKPGHTAIYIDGELAAETDAITISPADVKPVINYLGKSQFSADPLFEGFLDDVRIYNRALTAADVAAIVSETSDIHATPAATHSSPSEVYTLDGIRLPQPRQGLNIIGGKIVKK